MLGNKAKNGFGGSSGSTTLIARDAQVTGNITFKGSLDVEGVVIGNIVAEPDQDATVRIVDKGRVEGEIHAPSVVVNGVVVGDVYSSKHLELAAKARVQGNVHYTLVEMMVGAEVNGSLKHCAQGDAAVSAATEDETVGEIDSSTHFST